MKLETLSKTIRYLLLEDGVETIKIQFIHDIGTYDVFLNYRDLDLSVVETVVEDIINNTLISGMERLLKTPMNVMVHPNIRSVYIYRLHILTTTQ